MKRGILLIIAMLAICNLIIAQSDYANRLSIEVGYGGGDGVFPTPLYGLEYTRSLSKRIDGYVKYVQSNGGDDRYGESLNDKFISQKNEANSVNTRFSQFYSFGIGLKPKIVKMGNIDLYVIVGARYLQAKKSQIVGLLGSQSNPDIVVDYQNIIVNGIGYDLGIGYNRVFKEKFSMGGAINLTQIQSRISFSLHIGVLF